ncbi:hypothetical protein ACQ4PT_010889 [Festuca glaucescens]
MLLKLGEVPTVFISSAEGAAQALKTNELAFSSRPRSVTLDIFGGGGKDIAFAPYSDHWRQMRKVCVMELISSKQVRRMEVIRVQEVGNLLDSITASNGATLNVSQMLAALSVDVVTQAIFGGKFAQQDEYLREVDKAFVLVSGSSLVDLFPSSRLVRWLSSDERRMRSCYGRIQRIITDIIDERKAARDGSHGVCGTNEEDLLGVLLRLQLEDSLQFPLTAELVVAYKAFVLVSGSSLVDLFPSSRLVRWLSSDERRMRSCYGRIQRIITDIIDERKAARDGSHGVCGTNEEDLLGVLLRLQLEDSLQFPLTAELVVAYKAFVLVSGSSLVDLFPSSRLVRWLSSDERRMRSCYGRIQRIITDIIDERKAARDGSHGVCGTNEEDLLGVLLRLQLEDSLQFPLTAELVVAYKAFVLVSGSSLVDLFPSSRLVRWLSSDECRMRSCYGRIQRIITDIIDERKAARDGSHGVCGTNEEDLLGVLLRLQLEDSLQFPLTAENEDR